MKRWFRRLRANCHYLRKPFLRFLPSLLLLMCLLIGGGCAFYFLYELPDDEPLTFLRALHLTYCLIFMEHLLKFPDHWLVQLFYFLLPPVGLVVILDAFTRFGYHVLRRDESGAEWMRALARTYRGHVILCGLGKVGLRVLQELDRLGEDVVALEKDPLNKNLAYARRNGVPVLIGDVREAGILDDLNVAGAKSIITATNDDLANLELALDARKARPGIRVVMRMFDQDLASKIRDSFEIHSAFSTSALSAPLFATSSSDRSIINSFYVGDDLLLVARLKVNPDSELIGKKIRDMGAEYGVFVLAHERGTQQAHFPSTSITLEPGDQIVVQTEPEKLRWLHKLNRDKYWGAAADRGHVILCGLGNVGLRVLQQLIRLGEEVKVLEKDEDNENLTFAKKNGVKVYHGDMREEGILKDLGIDEAKSIITATGNDLANLEIALDARKARPDIRVVMRMYDQELASKIRESFDIHLGFSTAALAAPLFATSSSDPSIINSFYVGEPLLAVARLTVHPDSKLIGKRIRDLGTKQGVFFLAHKRGLDEVHFPNPDLVFEPGDQIVVLTEPDRLKRLHGLNGSE